MENSSQKQTFESTEATGRSIEIDKAGKKRFIDKADPT